MVIRKILFTGSVPTGNIIKKYAADSNLKNATLEFGGKNPLMIFDDADLQQAIPAAAVSTLVNSGQGCIPTAMAEIGGSLGDPTIDTTGRGPQADGIQFDRVMSYLQYAKDQKFEIPLGGNRAGDKDYFIEGTIIANVT
ncbi:Aldehyde/histidinol dehydrogenase [Massariosphaeria phaeospora]|uniref:aldehyde dehydrogenase (NAD(+)) n=1 Tax=Massariosphaeria phaeospora TaxID=100035 RepID=A0A7C8IGR3_9PLEO|nr:Aldehyde/histidinol dehydrogenase [Massariosphaeria phaeospora]